MDEIIIKDVILTPLNKISHPKGDIFHGMKSSDVGFTGFGEAYFSTIKNGEIKGWNKHNSMTMNLIVPVGSVKFVLYDDRKSIRKNINFLEVELSPDNYHRLSIPPGLWLAFKGNGSGTNLILNIASTEHDTDEIERTELEKISYNWNSV